MLGSRPAFRGSTLVQAVAVLGMVAACAYDRSPLATAAAPVTVRAKAAPPPPTAESGSQTAAEAESSPSEALAEGPPVTVMPDVDYWATPQVVVDRMLEIARVESNDVVYDLGCGDARSLVTAAKRYGAKGVGFEIDPRVAELARENVREIGVENLVRIEETNIFDLDLSPASVVFLYLTQRLLWRLVPQFEKMRRTSGYYNG